jgi:hypothetical protein
MSPHVAAAPKPIFFDDSNIRWHKLGDLENMVFAMLNVDESLQVVDFIIKFDPNKEIVLHRHLTLTNTFVVQGEHRLYEPNGDLKEIRPVGGFTSSPPGPPHREGAGADGAIVMYTTYGEVNGVVFELVDDAMNVLGTLTMDDFKAAYAEQRAA